MKALKETAHLEIRKQLAGTVTFLFHPFHIHQLLHVVGVIQP